MGNWTWSDLVQWIAIGFIVMGALNAYDMIKDIHAHIVGRN